MERGESERLTLCTHFAFDRDLDILRGVSSRGGGGRSYFVGWGQTRAINLTIEHSGKTLKESEETHIPNSNQTPSTLGT